jgi:hypothetical protein
VLPGRIDRPGPAIDGQPGYSPIGDALGWNRTIEHRMGSFPLMPGSCMKHATVPDPPLARHFA